MTPSQQQQPVPQQPPATAASAASASADANPLNNPQISTLNPKSKPYYTAWILPKRQNDKN